MFLSHRSPPHRPFAATSDHSGGSLLDESWVLCQCWHNRGFLKTGIEGYKWKDSYTFFWYADEIFWVVCGLRIFRWVSVNLLEWFLQFSSTYWRCTRWISSIVGRRTVRHVNSCTVQLRISKAESCSLWTFTFWFIDCWRKYQNNDRLFQLWNTQISHLPLLLLHWLPPLFKTPQSYFSVSLSFADWLSPRYKFTWRPFHPVQVVPRRWFQSTTFPSPELCLHLTQGWTP